MKLRNYAESDCAKLAQLFYDTVHTVNAKDYTAEQLDAWASGAVDLEKWNRSFLEHRTIIAEEDDRIIGFGDMDSTGYLDRLYVHRTCIRRGVATAICDVLEKDCKADCFTTHASVTAKPFFEQRGYVVVKEQQVHRRGQWLTNFVMQKKKIKVGEGK